MGVTNNERVPAGTADRLAAAVEKCKAVDDSPYERGRGMGAEVMLGRCLAHLRSIEEQPLTRTLAEALAMAEPGDVLRGDDSKGNVRHCFKFPCQTGPMHCAWMLDNRSPWLEQSIRDSGNIRWHTFIHNGVVYSIRGGEAVCGCGARLTDGKCGLCEMAAAAAEASAPLAVGDRVETLTWPPGDTGVKQCCRCNQIKPHSEFHRRNSAMDGCKSWCKECDREYHQERRRIPAVRAADLTRQAARRAKYPDRITTCPKCGWTGPQVGNFLWRKLNRTTGTKQAIIGCKYCPKEI